MTLKLAPPANAGFILMGRLPISVSYTELAVSMRRVRSPVPWELCRFFSSNAAIACSMASFFAALRGLIGGSLLNAAFSFLMSSVITLFHKVFESLAHFMHAPRHGAFRTAKGAGCFTMV